MHSHAKSTLHLLSIYHHLSLRPTSSLKVSLIFGINTVATCPFQSSTARSELREIHVPNNGHCSWKSGSTRPHWTSGGCDATPVIFTANSTRRDRPKRYTYAKPSCGSSASLCSYDDYRRKRLLEVRGAHPKRLGGLTSKPEASTASSTTRIP